MGSKIEFLNLKRQNDSVKKGIDFAIKRIFDRANFIGGDEVKELENEIAKFCKVKYAISVNSGTDALFLSLKALGIKTSEEVITTPFTFIATAEVIANLGAKPVFVDIKEDTFNINPELIEKAITSKTKAIIPVHLFGRPTEMKKIMEIAKKYHLYVIEDAAQAFGAGIGKMGDCRCFSFFPSKNLGGIGDGGMVVTNNKKLANKIRLLKNHGSLPKDKYKNLILGTNSRLDTVQAAVLKIKLKYLNIWNKKRKNIAQNYIKNLKNVKKIILPKISEGHIFNQFTIETGSRDELKNYLEKKGVETKIYYPLALHLQPALKYLGYKKGDFPISEKKTKEVLSLPIYPELENNEQKYIIKNIIEFYENFRDSRRS